MKRGSKLGALPVGSVTKLLPGGRRKKVPGLSGITKALPGGGGGIAKSLPGGRAVGTAGGVLLGAGAAVAASRAFTGRKGEDDSSNQEEPEQKKNARNKNSQDEDSKAEAEDTEQQDEQDEQAGKNGQGVFGRIKDTVGGVVPGIGNSDEEDDGKDEGKGGGKGGGGKKVKVTNIVEHIDIGAPRRLVYDQWTQFQDYPSFMKKVISVDQADETKLNWQAKIFWSKRTWEATIIEQVPDEHIVWRSQGAKGHVDGTVSFHKLSPNLTRVLLVLEYHPQGFFERTGNIWRAQGRRVRLELKHFRRFVMTQSLTRADEVEGWRGEIRDSEVVLTHEDALDEEERDRKDDAPESKKRETDERETDERETEEEYETAR
ncbi:SRPBCC family protein [Actinomadura sp. 7K534]|uniref:SRPBCC family protein n=1 Tax=Actinomadura sp. 7K534 TaxID=2530366 RepID=UPI001051E99A|nr:SRPBCC family protein [Actinomadura sp. 7K534]TDB92971.1 SRPBCC family protein [Actinomadura sp. 7K534]